MPENTKIFDLSCHKYSKNHYREEKFFMFSVESLVKLVSVFLL
jgi:hypothetical protein